MKIDKRVYVGTDEEELKRIFPDIKKYWEKDPDIYEELQNVAEKLYFSKNPKYVFSQQMLVFVRLYLEEVSNEGYYYNYTVWHSVREHLEQKDYVFIDHEKEIWQMMLFFQYAMVKTKYLAPKNKIGTKKNGYYNNTPSGLTIVDTNWNTNIVVTGGVGVKGHFRLQPCGTERKNVKLIWIDAFKKNGYKKIAKKLNID